MGTEGAPRCPERKPADLAGTYSFTEQMRSMGREPRSQLVAGVNYNGRVTGA